MEENRYLLLADDDGIYQVFDRTGKEHFIQSRDISFAFKWKLYTATVDMTESDKNIEIVASANSVEELQKSVPWLFI